MMTTISGLNDVFDATDDKYRQAISSYNDQANQMYSNITDQAKVTMSWHHGRRRLAPMM